MKMADSSKELRDRDCDSDTDSDIVYSCSGEVYCCTFSPSGDHILTGSQHGAMMVIN